MEDFGAAITQLLSMVDPEATPFQIVARVGDTSRAFQLEKDWNEAKVKAELWDRYRNLADVNG